MHIRPAAVASCLLSLVVLAWQPAPPTARKAPFVRALPGPMDIVYWSPVEVNYRYGPTGEALSGRTSNLAAPASSTFVVTYDSNFAVNPQAQAAFQAAVNIWANVVASSVPIRVNAKFTELGSNILGSAGPTSICSVFGVNQFYAAALADKIAGVQGCAALSGSSFEIDANFSSSFTNWDFGTSGVGVAGKVNFLTVVLHELGHGLGFYGSFVASSSTLSGTNPCTPSNPSGTFLGCSRFSQPDVFDLFAVTGAGTSLRSLPDVSTTLATQLVGNDVFFNGTNTRANNQSQNAKLESHNFNTAYLVASADNGFLRGSSFSHVDDVLYTGSQNGLMTWALGNNEVFTDPGPIVRGIFLDEGWTIAGTACSYGISPTSVTAPSTGSTGSSVTVSTTAGCTWTATSNASFIAVTSGSAGTGNGTVTYSVSANAGANQRVGTITIAGQTFTVTQNGTAPTLSLDKTGLQFAAISTGASFVQQTASQSVRISQSGAGSVAWTASTPAPWLTVTPTSGTGPAVLTIDVRFDSSVAAPGATNGTITISAPTAGNASSIGPISVGLTTISNGLGASPSGVFETPVDGSTGLTGSIAVTGWAIDDVEVRAVRIMRDAVPSEGAGLVFIGNATLVEGSRTDIAQLNPTKPRNTRAGWGYLLLTNFLPNQGTGTYKLYAFGDDAEGHSVQLGTKTISCSNATATKPFGAIDTPGQGAVISGASFPNFGWVLSRTPALAFPPNGTVQVVIDGVFGASPTGWASRPDLTALFPAATYPGVGNALGVTNLNTTTLANGVHTIAWVVTDNLNQADGIGSRFFTVANDSGLTFGAEAEPVMAARGSNASLTVEAPPLMTAVGEGLHASAASLAGEVNAARLDRSAIRGRRGFARSTPFRTMVDRSEGRAVLYGEELDRFEVRLANASAPLADGSRYTGYTRAGNGLGPLPIGSHLDQATGTFTWTPGPGFLHDYDLVFVRWEGGRAASRQEVRLVVNPKTSNRVGPQVVIDTPASAKATAGQAAPGSVRQQPFVVAGWAIDPDSGFDTGIDTLHVWAYPLTCLPAEAGTAKAGHGATCNSASNPIFLGATAYGGSRPDVAAIYGDRFRRSGYGITVESLPAGTYDLAVFAWSTAVNGFIPAKVIRVSVR